MGAWVPALMAGLSALNGAAGQNQYPGANDPASSTFRNNLIMQWQNLMNPMNQSGFQTAYTTNGLKNIYRAGNNEATSVGDFLSSRGLGRTTGGVGTLRDVAYDIGRRHSDFLSGVPLVMDQRNQDILKNAGALYTNLPQAGAQPTSLDSGIQGGVSAHV